MIRQILSDETMNRKGYITLNDGVNWDEYRKNPVLMLEHEDDKQPIGRIDNIRFEDNAWYGDLVFADTEEGREKEKLYNEGFYNAVSISGLWKAPLTGRGTARPFFSLTSGRAASTAALVPLMTNWAGVLWLATMRISPVASAAALAWSMSWKCCWMISAIFWY